MSKKKEMTIGEACRTILRSGKDALLGFLTFKDFRLDDDATNVSKGYTKDEVKTWKEWASKPRRARLKDGTYRADDRETGWTNEAWVGGKAPKKKKK